MTTNIKSHATVTTEKPVAYMRQLCKHFGHKIETGYDETTGYILFSDGRCDLEADLDATSLILIVTAETRERVERVRNVVGSHLERFGRRDELSVSWA